MLRYLLESEFDLIILDPDIKELSGLELIPCIKKVRPDIPMIVTSDESSYETGVKIAQEGVYFRMGKLLDNEITNEVLRSVETPKK